jgi:hypothetical protein
VGEYDAVHSAWERLSRDQHVGMSNAVAIVQAAANTDEGRRALSEILSDDSKVALVEADALSYLHITRDIPLPSGVEDQRIDAYFRDNLYTGTRLTKTHQLRNPKEFLYFNMAVGLITGTLDNLSGARMSMAGSGFEPVVVDMPGGGKKAIGTMWVNEFRDTTFGPYNELIFGIMAVPEQGSGVPRSVPFVNGFSLQRPLDQGATLYFLKLWLDQLAPIDGGNDFLGTNKELGAFVFRDTAGTREFQAVDKDGMWLARGVIPRTFTSAGAAAARAGNVSTNRLGAFLFASRPDQAAGKPATKWAYAIDWRRPVVTEVSPADVALRLGDGEWGRRLRDLQFTPMLTTFGPQCVGRIYQNVSEVPFVLQSSPAREADRSRR